MRTVGLLVVFLAVLVLQGLFLVEQFAATSPGTLMQLQSSRAGVFGIVDSGDWVPRDVVAMPRWPSPGYGFNTIPVY
jgi:hypothetical protein